MQTDQPPFTPSAPVQRRLQRPRAKSKFLAVTKLSQYAMGRRMNYADSEMIHRLLEESKKNDYKLRDLIVSIIADESFAKR